MSGWANIFRRRCSVKKSLVPKFKSWSVLTEYGISWKLLKAIKSLYLNSRAAVRVEGELSKWFEACNGPNIYA